MSPLPASSRRLLTSCVAAGAWLAVAVPAGAATYHVNVREDADNSATCKADVTGGAQSNCTLRGAVIRAQLDPGEGTIVLAPGAPYTVSSTLGPLEIDTENQVTTIDGGNGSVIQATGAAHRLFELDAATDTTFVGLTLSGGSAATGGAIHSLGDVTVLRSTLSGNTATGSGGAIAMEDDGVLGITDSTLAGNTAPKGSAIAFDTTDATAIGTSTILDGTIARNTGGRGVSYIGDNDGDATNDGIVNVKHTILADGCSVEKTGNPVSVGATIKDNGSNLDGGTTCGLAAGSSTDPQLTDLTATFFGGPKVLVPKPGSPAIDTGGTVCSSKVDERPFGAAKALSRPIDGNSDGTKQCDIGAVEFTPASRTVTEGTPTQTSETLKVAVTNGDAPVRARVIYGPSVDNYPNSAEVDVPFTSDTATVDVNLTGLAPGTAYHYRVQLLDGASTVSGIDGSFVTKRFPAVAASAPADITQTSATLKGRLDDNNLADVKWHFEYGTTTAYGTSTPDVGAAVNANAVDVSTGVSGLNPATTYHYRLVATYGGQTFASGDRVFDTAAATVPPVPPALTLTLGKLGKVKLAKAKKYAVKVTCSQDCKLTAKLTTTKKLAKKLKLKTTLLKASGKGTANTASKVTFKLSKKLLKKLRAKRVKSLKLTVTATPATGSPATATGTVKLKR